MTDEERVWRRCTVVYAYGILIGSTVFVWLGIPPKVLVVGILMAVSVGLGWVIPAACREP